MSYVWGKRTKDKTFHLFEEGGLRVEPSLCELYQIDYDEIATYRTPPPLLQCWRCRARLRRLVYDRYLQED